MNRSFAPPVKTKHDVSLIARTCDNQKNQKKPKHDVSQIAYTRSKINSPLL